MRARIEDAEAILALRLYYTAGVDKKQVANQEKFMNIRLAAAVSCGDAPPLGQAFHPPGCF